MWWIIGGLIYVGLSLLFWTTTTSWDFPRLKYLMSTKDCNKWRDI